MKHNVKKVLMIGVLVMAAMALAGCPAKPKPQPPKPECESNADCPEGKQCRSGKCVAQEAPKPECSSDADCPDPKVCKNGKCSYECRGDADCGAGAVCKGNRCISEASLSFSEVCKIQTIYFDFDQYYLTSEAQEMLRAATKCMLSRQVKKVSIGGYCDERGTDAYNLALGDRRAKAVKKFMVEMGMSSKIIDSVSYGEEYAASCTDESCWYKDRKGAITVSAE